MYKVDVQLNTLMAEGIATRKLNKRKNESRVDRLSGDEHVVSPDQETEHRNGHAGKRDDLISKDALSGKNRQ